MMERRAQGLCYNCDEKYSKNHKCEANFLLLIDEEQNDEYEQCITEDLELQDDFVDGYTISYHHCQSKVFLKQFVFKEQLMVMMFLYW